MDSVGVLGGYQNHHPKDLKTRLRGNMRSVRVWCGKYVWFKLDFAKRRALPHNSGHKHSGAPKEVVIVTFNDIEPDSWAMGGTLFSDK